MERKSTASANIKFKFSLTDLQYTDNEQVVSIRIKWNCKWKNNKCIKSNHARISNH